MWNEHFFERSDILAHDLTLNLSHYPDDCPSIPLDTDGQTLFDTEVSDEADEFVEHSESTPHFGSRSNLIIISSTGIFQRSVRWCHCAKKTDQYVQLLLRARLFPASFKNPKTAFTFEVLDHFLIDSLECKTAAMNFMSKIRRMTNEAFPSCVPVRFPMYRTGLQTLIIRYRTATVNCFGSLESGGIFTIVFGLESFMIGRILPLMVVWHCFAPPVHRLVLTYPLRSNGNPTISKEKLYFLVLLTMTFKWHRLLYRPQLVVDGNMKLVHLIMKRPEDDVSLSDGEQFMVKRAPYAEHVAKAPQRQPVSSQRRIFHLLTDTCQEIEV